MGSRKNNRNNMKKRGPHIPDEKDPGFKKPKEKQQPKKPLLEQKKVAEVLDHIFQGLRTHGSQKLNLGEIKKEHKVKIYSLYEELVNDTKNQNLLSRIGKSELEIADVIVDYIKVKNQPLDVILNNLSKKEIDAINKLIFYKLFFKK